MLAQQSAKDLLEHFALSVNTLGIMGETIPPNKKREHLEAIVRIGKLLLTNHATEALVVSNLSDIHRNLPTAQKALFMLNIEEGRHVGNLLLAKEMVLANLNYSIDEALLKDQFDKLSTTDPSLALPYVLLLIRSSGREYMSWLYHQLVNNRISVMQMRFMAEILFAGAKSRGQLESKCYAYKMIYLMTDPSNSVEFGKAEAAAVAAAQEAKRDDLQPLFDLTHSVPHNAVLGLELQAYAFLFYAKDLGRDVEEKELQLVAPRNVIEYIKSERNPKDLVEFIKSKRNLATCYLGIIALNEMGAKNLKERPAIAKYAEDIICFVDLVSTQTSLLTKKRLVKLTAALSRLPISSAGYKSVVCKFLHSFIERLPFMSLPELLRIASAIFHVKLAVKDLIRFIFVLNSKIDIMVSSSVQEASAQDCLDTLYVCCTMLMGALMAGEAYAYNRTIHSIEAAVKNINARQDQIRGGRLRDVLFAESFLAKVNFMGDPLRKPVKLNPELIALAKQYVEANPLRTKSSQLHRKQSDFLKSLGLLVEDEKTIDRLLNVDMLLPRFDTIIDIRGSQHYKFSQSDEIEEIVSTDDWHEFLLGCVTVLRLNWDKSSNSLELEKVYQAVRKVIVVNYQELYELDLVSDELRYDFWQQKLPKILPPREEMRFSEIREKCRALFAQHAESEPRPPQSALAASMHGLLRQDLPQVSTSTPSISGEVSILSHKS